MPGILALLATGCATNGPNRIEYVTVDTSCTRFKPVYLKQADVLTEETATVILGNNRAGQSKCGWKPVAKP